MAHFECVRPTASPQETAGSGQGVWILAAILGVAILAFGIGLLLFSAG